MFTDTQRRNLNTLDIIISIISFLGLITTLAIILVVSDEMVKNIFSFQLLVLFLVNINTLVKIKHYFKERTPNPVKIKKPVYKSSFNYNSLVKY